MTAASMRRAVLVKDCDLFVLGTANTIRRQIDEATARQLGRVPYQDIDANAEHYRPTISREAMK